MAISATSKAVLTGFSGCRVFIVFSQGLGPSEKESRKPGGRACQRGVICPSFSGHDLVNILSGDMFCIRILHLKEIIRENHRSGKDFSISGSTTAGTRLDRPYGGSTGRQAGTALG